MRGESLSSPFQVTAGLRTRRGALWAPTTSGACGRLLDLRVPVSAPSVRENEVRGFRGHRKPWEGGPAARSPAAHRSKHSGARSLRSRGHRVLPGKGRATGLLNRCSATRWRGALWRGGSLKGKAQIRNGGVFPTFRVLIPDYPQITRFMGEKSPGPPKDAAESGQTSGGTGGRNPEAQGGC